MDTTREKLGPSNGEMIRSWNKVFTGLLVSCFPIVLFGQELTGTIRDERDQPVAGITLRLLRSQTVTISDRNGRYVIPSSLSGTDTLLVRGLGWEPMDIEIELFRGASVQWSIRLKSISFALDTVKVQAKVHCPSSSPDGFECRRRYWHRGVFRDARELQELRPGTWADLFDGLPGVRRTIDIEGNPFIESTTGWRCLAQLINGEPVMGAKAIFASPLQVHQLEYYPTYRDVPEEYRRFAWQAMQSNGLTTSINTTCGVVVYWMRPKPR